MLYTRSKQSTINNLGFTFTSHIFFLFRVTRHRAKPLSGGDTFTSHGKDGQSRIAFRVRYALYFSIRLLLNAKLPITLSNRSIIKITMRQKRKDSSHYLCGLANRELILTS